MPNTYWKSIERRIARMFGSRRIGTREGGPAPDFENSWVVGEVVCHPVPKWILTELAQAERRQTDRPKLRLLVIHEKGQPLEAALVVMRMGQFTEWFLRTNEQGKVKLRTDFGSRLNSELRTAL